MALAGMQTVSLPIIKCLPSSHDVLASASLLFQQRLHIGQTQAQEEAVLPEQSTSSYI
jgi:hypothetical protein